MEAKSSDPIRMGMVGGGSGAFIGGVHRIAARMDGHYRFLAGALSSSAEKSLASGRELGLEADRIYGTFAEMASKEARRADGIEVVSITTPNHVHFPAAKAFLEAGIHVICDKPMTITSGEAQELVDLVERTGKVFMLTHNYTGYPMVRKACAMVEAGELGVIRVVQAEYPQDWLAEPIEQQGQKQATWRSDPAQSGAGGSIGDVGTHAWNLLSFVTGLETQALAAELSRFVPGRKLDDHAHIMLRFAPVGGNPPARGLLWSSQVATGHENDLRLRVYGTKAGIEWSQTDPNYLWVTPLGQPRQKITRASTAAGDIAGRVTRIPAGHPEGYLEGFANLYHEAAMAIRAAREQKPVPSDILYPTVYDGLLGMKFIEACVRSSARDAAWEPL